VTPLKVTTALLYPLLYAAAAFLIGRPLVRFVLSRAGGDGGRAAATVVLLILLSGGATEALGLEPIYGAFICGAVISSSGGLDMSTVNALRPLVLTFLVPVYFATAGLRMNLRTLDTAGVIGTALLVLLIAVAGKFLGAYIGARASKLSSWEGLALGASMNSRGIVEVVVATVGIQTGVLTIQAYTIVILVAVLTSLIAPPVLRIAVHRIEPTEDERILLKEEVSVLD
jgi:Kef-type K+ transport system membrane component KefB